mgnify:CR=1 FL=1
MTCNLNFIKLKGEDYTSSLYIYYFFSIECFWIGYPISLMYVMDGEDFDKDKKEFDLIVVLLFQNIKNFGYVYLSIEECQIYDIISENYIFNSIIIDVDDASKLCETKADIENKMESTIAVNDMVSSLKANE